MKLKSQRDSILESSKKNALSFEELTKLSNGLTQTLSSVSGAIARLDDQINQGFKKLEEGQTVLEANIEKDTNELKSCLTRLEILKEYVDKEDDRQGETRSRWQQDLEATAISVQRATATHLELQMQDLRLEVRKIEDKLSKKQAVEQSMRQVAIKSAFDVLGSGIAGALGAMLAITA